MYWTTTDGRPWPSSREIVSLVFRSVSPETPLVLCRAGPPAAGEPALGDEMCPLPLAGPGAVTEALPAELSRLAVLLDRDSSDAPELGADRQVLPEDGGRQRPLVFDAGAVLRQRGGSGIAGGMVAPVALRVHSGTWRDIRVRYLPSK